MRGVTNIRKHIIRVIERCEYDGPSTLTVAMRAGSNMQRIAVELRAMAREGLVSGQRYRDHGRATTFWYLPGQRGFTMAAHATNSGV